MKIKLVYQSEETGKVEEVLCTSVDWYEDYVLCLDRNVSVFEKKVKPEEVIRVILWEV